MGTQALQNEITELKAARKQQLESEYLKGKEQRDEWERERKQLQERCIDLQVQWV